MKCWIGKELENNSNFGNITLFVESSNLNLGELRCVIKILEQYYKFDSIYLGAGEINVHTVINNLSNLDFLYKYYILLENGINNKIVNLPNDLIDDIIIRIDFENINKSKMTTIKLRQHESVLLRDLSDFICTNITTVKDGQYETDKLVYNNGEFYL